MIRLLHAIAITLLIGSAGYAYSIKYDALYFSEQIAKLKGRLQKERDSIAVAKAEWALLSRPDRLQRMVEQHLDLQPMAITQLARISELPVKDVQSDEIGRKLEALGLSEPTATPTAAPSGTQTDRRSGDARASTTRTPAR